MDDPQIPSDRTMTVHALREIVRQFVEEREWRKFHTPKNVAMGIAIEAAELMEHFQWLSGDESRAIADDPERCAAAAEELSDVICYCLALANELGLDLVDVFQKKMAKNRLKYPATEYRGRYE